MFLKLPVQTVFTDISNSRNIDLQNEEKNLRNHVNIYKKLEIMNIMSNVFIYESFPTSSGLSNMLKKLFIAQNKQMHFFN